MSASVRPQALTDGVLSEAWRLYKAHWQHLLAVAFVVFAGIALVGAVAASLLERPLAALIALLVTLLGYFWVQAALVKAVEDLRDGRVDLSVSETLSYAWGRIGPVATASSLAAVAIFLGFVLLVVPGFVLLTWWVLIVPVIVLENARAGRSFGRSRELVRGFGWKVFGVVVLTFLVLLAAEIGLGLLLAPLADWLEGLVSYVVRGTLTAPFVALAWTLLYYRLRAAKAPAPETAPLA